MPVSHLSGFSNASPCEASPLNGGFFAHPRWKSSWCRPLVKEFHSETVNTRAGLFASLVSLIATSPGRVKLISTQSP